VLDVALAAELETKLGRLRLEYEDMMPRLSFGYSIKWLDREIF
jgi:hypothetical protein